MSLTSRHLLTDAINYFHRVMSGHEKVDRVILIEEDFYKAIFEIYLTDGRLLITYIADVYVLTAADVREVVSEYEEVDCIVVVSNWDHYTPDAKNVAKEMRIGVYTLKEFMKAINYNISEYDIQLYLFGSARVNKTPNDIDILLIYPDNKRVTQAIELKKMLASYLQDLNGIEIHMVLLTVRENEDINFLKKECAVKIHVNRNKK